MRAVGHEHPAGGVDAPLGQLVELAEECLGLQHHAVADDAGHLAVQDPGGDLAEDEVRVADHDRVAGVGAALVANDQVGPLGQDVDQLALALVTPLRPDDHHAGGLRVEHVRSPTAAGWPNEKSPSAGLQHPRANVCTGTPTVNSPRAPVPPGSPCPATGRPACRPACESSASVRQVSRPIVTAGTPALANGTLSVRIPTGRRRTRPARPALARRGASARARAAPRASWHTRASSPSWSMVSRFTTTTSRSRSPRRAHERARTHQPELLGAGDQDPGGRVGQCFGRGERGRHAGAVVPGALRGAAEAAPARESARQDGEPGRAAGQRKRDRPAEPCERQRQQHRGRQRRSPRRRPACPPSTGPAPWYPGGPRSTGGPGARHGWR